MEIAEKCIGETFSLTGEDGSECFEGVDSFKYLGQVLHWSDDYWMSVCQNIWRSRQVWEQLGKFLRREGADTIVSENFYRTLVQAILLFGSGTWVLTTAIMKKIEGIHVSFMRKVTGMKA